MSQLAAIYCRLSTDDKEQTSIPKQIDLCRAAASKHGIVVPENYIFVDDGYSGALLERPALNRLLELARSRSITSVFVLDADRLSREPTHDGIIREDLKRFDVTLYVNGQAIDVSPEGEIKDGILAWVAKYERIKIVQRMKLGKLRRAGLHRDVGQPLGGLMPLGYRYVPDTPECKGHIEIVPEEADIVKRIYEMCISGMGMHKIATILTHDCIKTKTGNSAWHISSVAKVLHNETYYTGKFPFNRYERVEPDDSRRRNPKNLKNLKTTRRLRDKSEWLYIDIPTVIDEAMYLAAQKQISRNREANPRNRKHEYLFLGGRLRCACGKTMVGYVDNRGTRRYRCNSKTILSAKPCRGTARADTIESNVWDVLVANLNLLRDPAYLKRYLDQKIGRANAETNQTAERVESVYKQIATLERKQQTLLDRHLDGSIDAETFRKNKARLDQEREPLERLRDELQASRQAVDPKRITSAVSYVREILDHLPQADLVEKRKVLEAIDLHVVRHSSGQCRIFFDLPGEDDEYHWRGEASLRAIQWDDAHSISSA